MGKGKYCLISREVGNSCHVDLFEEGVGRGLLSLFFVVVVTQYVETNLNYTLQSYVKHKKELDLNSQSDESTSVPSTFVFLTSLHLFSKNYSA